MLRYLILVLFCCDLIVSDAEVLCGCKCQPSFNELSDDSSNLTCTVLNRERCCEGTEARNLTVITANELLTTTDSANQDDRVTEAMIEDNLVIVYPHQMSGIPKIKTNFEQTERISVRSFDQDQSILVVYPQPLTDAPEPDDETTEIPESTEPTESSESTTEILEYTEQTTEKQFEDDEFESVTIAYSSKVFQSVPTDLPSVTDSSSQITIQPHIKLNRTVTPPHTSPVNLQPTETSTKPSQIEPNTTQSTPRQIDTNIVKPTISLEDIKIKRQNQFREFLKQKSMKTKTSAEIVENKPSPMLVNIRKNLLDTMNRRVPFLRPLRNKKMNEDIGLQGNETKEILGTTESAKEITEVSSTRKLAIARRQNNKTRIVRFKSAPIDE